MPKSRVYSFSVLPSDIKTIELIEQIKMQCKQTGMSFSHFVLDALKTKGVANES